MYKITRENYLFMTLWFVIVLAFFSNYQPAHADSFGSQCVKRSDGKMLCAFWQWDSDKQVLIRKEVLRARRAK